MATQEEIFVKEKILAKWYESTEMALQLVDLAYSEFTPYQSSSLVKISSKPMQNDSNHLIRGDALVSNCTTAEYLSKIFTLNVQERKEFDAKTKQMAEMENWKAAETKPHIFGKNRHGEDSSEWFIRYMLVESPSLMVSNRDFVSIERFCYLNSENLKPGIKSVSIISSTSVSSGELSENNKVYSSSKTPKQGSAVRGDNILTFFRFEELESGDLRIIFFGQTNANGWIVPSIANQVIFDRPLNLEGIAKVLKKDLKVIEM